jgi:hypothetical protein
MYDFWKAGVEKTNVSIHLPFVGVAPDKLVIPKSSSDLELSVINTLSIIIHESYISKTQKYIIDLTDPNLTEMPIWKECLESIRGIKVERVDMKTMNLVGGIDSRIVTYPTEQSSLGFVPALLRRANELVYDAYTQSLELKDNLFSDIDGDGATHEDSSLSSKPIGLIVGEEWVTTLDKLCKKYRPDIEWKNYVNAKDIHFNELVNVKYVVGTSTGTAWITTMMMNPKKASVIEIAKEHEYDIKWYHVSSSIGCNHAVLPLKTEPTKQCVERIKKQLSVYFDELDKSFPA